MNGLRHGRVVNRYIKKRQRDRRHTKNATIVHALLTHPLYSHGGKRLEESKVPDGMLNKVGEKGEVTLQTIADDLGVTRVRVARLKKRYFDELKRPQIIAFKEGKRTALDLIREIDDNRPSPFG